MKDANVQYAPFSGVATEIAAAYDKFAHTYEVNRGLFDMNDVLREFVNRLPAHGELLDLGCGAGEPFASSFLGRHWYVTGVDVSGAMLKLAACYAPKMMRIYADMRDVDFAPESFDAICAIYSLFHVPSHDHPALFTRMREWLHPGGHLLFTYATAAYTGQPRFDGHKAFMGNELYYSHATTDELLTQLTQAGLELVEARERAIGGETFLWVTARRV